MATAPRQPSQAHLDLRDNQVFKEPPDRPASQDPLVTRVTMARMPNIAHARNALPVAAVDRLPL
jgi:hypothetical protein